jgi:dipeptidyl-peptidase 4
MCGQKDNMNRRTILAASPLAALSFLLCACAPAAVQQASPPQHQTPVGPPGAAQEQPAPDPLAPARALRMSAPMVHWNADGLLVYSFTRVDGGVHRALDPRTGAERPYVPPEVAAGEGPRVVRPGLFAHLPPIREVPTFDGGWFAGTRDGDVWVRPSGGGEAVRVTTMGQPRNGFDIEGAKWSPDGRRLAVRWLDEREVPTIPLVGWSEPGQPVERRPYSRAGEPIPHAALYFVGHDGGQPVRADLGGGGEPYLHIVGWSADGGELYLLRMSRLMDRLDLLGVDPRTGQSRVILSETAGSFIGGLPFLHGYTARLEELNHVVPLQDGRRFVWTSERDGWRRLYLYDLDGTLVRPLTPAGSEVDRLEAVDEERGLVYYTARVDPHRPYDVALLRAPLRGGAPERLLTGPAFYEIEFDPSLDFFWTMRAGLDAPPVFELRKADGAEARELWSGAQIVRELGWTLPEEVRATAADGETELFGLLFKPRDFDPTRKYPIVDHIYLGPHTAHVPRSLVSLTYFESQDLANLGFLVLVVDARGTPERGRAFQDAFFGQFGQHEIADHAAVLRHLAAERPYIDLERVGAIGHSWGGYGVLRALLLEPELYRVGVAIAAAVDLEHFRVSIEPFMGCLPADCPEAYELGSSTRLADRLQGRLLLVHGTSDDDVPFGDAVRMMGALNRASRPYDVVIFPEADHAIGEPYAWERVRSYLREHLGEAGRAAPAAAGGGHP